ncbi:MAG: bifunctional metallophosphatase/5'-nucleotidase, partial [Oscillospiraceae bacterium]|nr:bifunctional metallophosphatase/5'-nucleotidase [Oscillospiraceae bacterium]
MVLGLGTTAFAADAKSNDIVILHTDDVHCGVTDGMGYAGVAAYKAEMLKTHNYVALVDCGDAIQGEPIGTLSAGSYLVDIMNEVGY